MPVSDKTEQLADDCEMLVCSQEKRPGTHFSIKNSSANWNK